MYDKNRPLSKEEELFGKNCIEFIQKKNSDVSLERNDFGHLVLKYKKKSFFLMGPDYQTGILKLFIKSDKISQFEILKNKNFEVAPYLGHHGWVQIQTSKKIKKEFNYILEIISLQIKSLDKPKKKKK